MSSTSATPLMQEEIFGYQSKLFRKNKYQYEIKQLENAVIELENAGLEYAKLARNFLNQVKLYGSTKRFNSYQQIYPRNYNDYALYNAIHTATALFKTKAGASPESINAETTQCLEDFSKSIEFLQSREKKSRNMGIGMLVAAGLQVALAITLVVVASVVLLMPPVGCFMGLMLLGTSLAYGVMASGYFDRSHNLHNLINKMEPLRCKASP